MIKPNLVDYVHACSLAKFVKTVDRQMHRHKERGEMKLRADKQQLVRVVSSGVRELADRALRGE